MVGTGSVLSDSERFSRSKCFQGYTRSTKPLVRTSVCLHARGFGLMGEWCLSERASSAHIIAYLAQQVHVALRRSSP